MNAKTNTDGMLWVGKERVSVGSVQTTRCDAMDTEWIQLDLSRGKKSEKEKINEV